MQNTVKKRERRNSFMGTSWSTDFSLVYTSTYKEKKREDKKNFK
jgi:hypothetical protein